MEFREGDVVRTPDGLPRVVHSWDAAVVFTGETSQRQGWLASDCVLLRRPVRAGDMLRHGSPLGDPHEVGDDATFCALTAGNGWVHADGTAIEPPMPKRLGAYPELKCYGCGCTLTGDVFRPTDDARRGLLFCEEKCAAQNAAERNRVARMAGPIVGYARINCSVCGNEARDGERCYGSVPGSYCSDQCRQVSGAGAPKALTITHPEVRPILSDTAVSKLKSVGWTDEEIAAGRKRGSISRIEATVRFVSKADIEAAEAAKREGRISKIARTLFETDPDVTGFVFDRAESCGWDGRGTYEDFKAAREARYDATMQTAWDRGFAGESPEWPWYVRSVDRAKACVASEERRHPLVTVTT